MCLQCSGIHRNLSVQVSRIRSLDLDDLQTFELLVAYSMSNHQYNEVMEANLVDTKPNKETDAEERAQYIRNKYVQRKYIDRSETVDSLELLYEATDCRDFRALLQAYAEGVDMTQPLPNRVISFLCFNRNIILPRPHFGGGGGCFSFQLFSKPLAYH